MATLSTNRASYQHVSNIRIGKRKPATAPVVAKMTETQTINKCIALLRDANCTKSHSTFLYNISEVERLTRKMLKERL